MATQGQQVRESMIAGENLSNKQFTFVKMNTTDNTVVNAGDGEAAFGVVINDPALGEAATVVTHGRVMVEVGTGGIDAGDNVGVDANGEAVAAATNDIIVGVCVTAATAGRIGTIDFFRGGNASA